MANPTVLGTLVLCLLTVCVANLPCSVFYSHHKIVPPGAIDRPGTYEVSFPPSADSVLNCSVRVMGNENAVLKRIRIYDLRSNHPCYTQVYLFHDSSNIGRLQLCGENRSESYQGRWDNLTIYVLRSTRFFLQVDYVFLDGKLVLENKVELPAAATWNILSSFRYPKGYPNYLNFTYILKSGNSRRIAVSVIAMDMNNGLSRSCSRDYVEVIDGDALQRWCSGKPTMVSRGSTLRLVLHTDSQDTAPGFELLYREDDEGALPSPTAFSTSTPGPPCSSVADLTATAERRILTSPMYPYYYRGSLDCQWVVRGAGLSGSRIRVTFLDVELGYMTSLSQENVTVSYGSAHNRSVLDVFNRVPDYPTFSVLSSLNIRLRTMAYAKGFKLEYSTVDAASAQPCNSVVQLGTEFTYLDFPNDASHHPDFLNCTWRLQGVEGFFIALRSDILQMKASSCLHVFEDTPSSSRKFCGTTQLSVQSRGSTMLVQFNRTTSTDPARFRLRVRVQRYATSCEQGRVVNVSVVDSAQIQSPNFPDPYPAHSLCRWRLKSETQHPSKHLLLSSSTYQLGRRDTCASNYVKVYDGPDSTARMLAHFCTGEQGSLRASNGTLFVEFRSDGSTASTGFRVDVHVQETVVAAKTTGTVQITTVLVVGILAPVLFIPFLLVCICSLCYVHRRRQKRRRREVRGARSGQQGGQDASSYLGPLGSGQEAQLQGEPVSFISGATFGHEAAVELPPYPSAPALEEQEGLPPPYDSLEDFPPPYHVVCGKQAPDAQA